MQTWKKWFWSYALKVSALSLFLCCFLPSESLGQLIKPAITVQPLDKTVLVRSTVTLSVEAYSLLGVTYTWFHNGTAISGANENILTLPNVGPKDAGSYYVEVRNLVGPVNSRVATVSLVFPRPEIAAGKATPQGMKLNITGPTLYTYVISASSDLRNWTPVSTNTALNGSAAFSDIAVGNSPMRFYKTALGGATEILEKSNSGGNKFQIKAGSRGSQSFRHGTAADSTYGISKLLIPLSRDSSAPLTNLMVYIGTGINSGPLPGSLVAISPSTITNTSGGNSFQAYEVIYDNPVWPLAAGTTYYLNFVLEDPTRSIYIERTGNDYSNGTYFKEGSNQGKDMHFEIWGQ